MGEYSNFVSELVKGNNIMTKTFLVTVSFSIQKAKKKGVGTFVDSIKGLLGKKDNETKIDSSTFEQYRKQLLQRVEQVAVGLRGIGLRLAPLQTQEMLELFYTSLNPNTSRNQRLQNVAELEIDETEARDISSTEREKIPWAPS